MAERGTRLEQHEAVATLTIDRPHRANALLPGTMTALVEDLRSIGSTNEVGAVVLTGAGRSFCAGMDLDSGIGDPGPDQAERVGDITALAVDLMRTLREIPQPVVAAVNGHAAGGGLALAALCDIRVVHPSARFHAPFVRLGMTPGDIGLTWVLPRLIGHGRAADVLYRARTVDSSEALAWGLATEVTDEPLAVARRIAAELAAVPQPARSHTKRLLDASLAPEGWAAHVARELEAQQECFVSEGHHAALASARATK